MSKELMIPSDSLTPEIFTHEKKNVTALLTVVKKKVDEFKVDISTEESRKEAKDFAKKINRSKTAVDDMGKEHVAKLKELPNKIDAQRKLFRDGMDGYKDEILKPVLEWEEEEDARIKEHEALINHIIFLGDDAIDRWQEQSIDYIKAGVPVIEEYKERDWEEFKTRADQVITESIEKIETAIQKRKQYDAEKKELEELRKHKAEQERLEQERIHKEQQAKLDAERIEREKLEAEEARKRAEAELAEAKQKAAEDAKRAEEARIAAQEQAKKDAEEAARKERERIEAEQEKQRQEQEKREADQKHNQTIHEEIMKSLTDQGVDYNIAGEFLKLLQANLIPHVAINY